MNAQVNLSKNKKLVSTQNLDFPKFTCRHSEYSCGSNSFFSSAGPPDLLPVVPYQTAQGSEKH